MSESLSLCPFCGGEARDRRKVKGAYLDVYIQCRICKAKGGVATGYLKTPYNDLLAAAVERWNRRTMQEAQYGGEA